MQWGKRGQISLLVGPQSVSKLNIYITKLKKEKLSQSIPFFLSSIGNLINICFVSFDTDKCWLTKQQQAEPINAYWMVAECLIWLLYTKETSATMEHLPPTQQNMIHLAFIDKTLILTFLTDVLLWLEYENSFLLLKE